MSEIWWLSFATDESSLGVIVLPRLEGEDFAQAVARTHALGINPGGEVAGASAPTDTWLDSGEAWALRSDMQGRLIPTAELEAMAYTTRCWPV